MVDVDNISVDSHAKGVPVIYDMNGDVVNSSKVTMSANEVAVSIPVLKTKTVRIIVTTVGEPAPGYEVSSISYQPDMVTVAGTLGDLVLLGSTLRAQCDITDKSAPVEENIDISSLWSRNLDSLRVVDEEKLAVTVTMKPYTEKTFDMSGEDIEIRGLSEKYTGKVTMLSETQLHVSGKSASMHNLTLQTLAPYIDLSEIMTTGSFTVPVCLEMPEGVLLNDVPFAVVEIERRSK